MAFNSFLLAMLSVPVVTLIIRRWRKAHAISAVLLMGSLVVGAAAAAAGFWRGQKFIVDVPQVASFSFALSVDRLSAFFLLLICFVSAPVILFSSSYVERHYAGARRQWLWVLLPLFLMSMVLVVTASTAFAFLFGWELMTLCSAGLILIDGDSEQRRHNIFIYLLMMHAGAAAVIGAFLLFLPHSSNLDFAQMRAGATLMPSSLRTAVFLLAFVGFGTKAGIVPLHLWLPKAHPIAPSPVSALMSGVMLKTAVYGFIRFAFDFLGAGPSWWGYLVLLVGAVSGLLGVLYAIAEHDLKRLLAYHSVENIGIIYLGLGSALVFMANHAPQWAALALTAALLHSLNHALFKSLLFLGAGAISDAAHTLDLEELGGLQKGMRLTGTVFLIACCSIVGLPLFNGFVSEWLTFRSFLAAAEMTSLPAAIILPLAAGALALIGGLAAACFAKVYGVAFLGRPRSGEAESAHEVSLPMQAGMLVLATACIVIGIFPGFVLRGLGALTEELLPGATLPPAAESLSGVLPWIALFVLAPVAGITLFKRAKRLTATWACGLPGLDERMQYTSTAFSKPLRSVFSQVYKADRAVEVVPADQPYFPVSISYRSVRTTSFEKSLYRPGVDAILAAANRLRQLQTGNIQIYLLYIFGALIALLMFMRWA
ncbi:MAG TPA: proton-conducting transporter membrane subunit [Terriglobales bacterium]|nr:proton-conducting transporter membrane subunit [Terriglobales bacterium]